jgi:hypothetical protein
VPHDDRRRQFRRRYDLDAVSRLVSIQGIGTILEVRHIVAVAWVRTKRSPSPAAPKGR